MKRRQTVSDNRMFAAADAILDVINSPAGRHGFIEMLVPAREPDEPSAPTDVRGPYTQRELMDATDFLARAGFLQEP